MGERRKQRAQVGGLLQVRERERVGELHYKKCNKWLYFEDGMNGTSRWVVKKRNPG